MYLRNISERSPDVLAAVAGYIERWNLPKTSKPSAKYWIGVFNSEYSNIHPAAVVGEAQREGCIEVTDLYLTPGSGRFGKLAVYHYLNWIKEEIKAGKKYVASCLYANKSFQAALKRVFGIEPTAVVYFVEKL